MNTQTNIQMNNLLSPEDVGGMPPNTIIRELASALCEAIRESSLEDLERDPEEAYVDLANRLVLRLAERHITVVPTFQHLFGRAALRTFKIFTEYLKKRPKTALNLLKLDREERFGVVAVEEAGSVRAFCRGEDAYDACAQLATAMAHEEAL